MKRIAAVLGIGLAVLASGMAHAQIIIGTGPETPTEGAQLVVVTSSTSGSVQTINLAIDQPIARSISKPLGVCIDDYCEIVSPGETAIVQNGALVITTDPALSCPVPPYPQGLTTFTCGIR